MLSILLMPVVGAAFKRPVILPLSLTLLAGLILWAHRNNIMDLIRREKISIPIKKLKEKIK
jgi:glycerol-3-phosphate acyltransferase PlsY